MKWINRIVSNEFQDLEILMKKLTAKYFGKQSMGGSLVKEAFNQVKKICSFDYMGSTEFEFGDVPKAFRLIAENSDNYSTKFITINGHTIFILGKTEDLIEIEHFIWKASKEEYIRLKECLYFYKKVNNIAESFRDHEWRVLRKTRNSSVNVCVAVFWSERDAKLFTDIKNKELGI